MILKDKIKVLLRERYGEFNTNLEHEYEDRLTEVLIVGNQRDKEAWVTYNQVMLELKNTLKDTLKVKELQYRLTENINPSSVCIEVISDIQTRTPELERLYNKIKNF
jgi:hypothetical protein